jgi:hypothetical protein
MSGWPPPSSPPEEAESGLSWFDQGEFIYPLQDLVDPLVRSYEYMLDDTKTEGGSIAEVLFEALILKNYGKEYLQWFRKYVLPARKRWRAKTVRHIRKTAHNGSKQGIQLYANDWIVAAYEDHGDGTYTYEWLKPRYHMCYPVMFHGAIQGEDMESPTSRILNPNQFFGSDLHRRCCDRALAQALPDLEDRFSLPVFLAELKDLPGMVKGLVRMIAKAPHQIRKLFQKPVQQWSKHQLAASFGWIPFVSEVKTIVERLYTLREDINTFLRDANKRRTYHYTIRLSEEDIEEITGTLDEEIIGEYQEFPAIEEWPWWYLSGRVSSLTWKHRMVPSISDVMYTTTLDYSYSLGDITMWAPLLAGMDRFGINLSLSDLWEVVPFSFVVDWFYDVQSLAERFDFTNLPAQIVINDFCESVKFGYSESHSFELEDIVTIPQDWSVGNWALSPVVSFPRYEEDVYYRRAGSPTVSREDFPNLTCPKGMQIILGSALIGSRL